MLARSKLNGIETPVSLELIDLEISHGEYKTVINKEENYRRLKEIRMIKNDDELNDEEGKEIENNKNIREKRIKHFFDFLSFVTTIK